MANFSPMMKQYLDMKEKYPNVILFFRLGDFYEMFFNDAKTVSKELELTLTGRDCGMEERAPMCGVPYHSAEAYIAKLVAKGYKVAICEQTEDPKNVKGIVKREVVRVITPGTVLESSMLDENSNNYICSLFLGDSAAGLAFADISTGAFYVNTLATGKKEDLEYEISNELARYAPSEILINPQGLDLGGLAGFIKERLNASLECLDEEEYAQEAIRAVLSMQFSPEVNRELEAKPEVFMASGALFRYLSRTQFSGLERINEVHYTDNAVMRLDLNARRNLEICETLRSKERRGSLLWVLDKTQTAMGKRLIKTWVEQPLLSPAKILQRQNAVEEIARNQVLCDETEEALSGIFDIERIISRIVFGSANARELRSLELALSRLPAVKAVLADRTATLLQDIDRRIDTLEDIRQLIDRAIVDDPPFTIREGGMLREGYHEELDSIREDMQGGQKLIAGVESREKERTGIPKLKIGYNRVFGYYIEVTNSYKHMVPETYIRKQTISSGERYITQELKEIENRILGAKDKSVALETKLFEELMERISAELLRIQKTARAVAELDVLASFARVSAANDYHRPDVNLSGKLYIKNGRHPVVEKLLQDTPFVPNDTDMDMHDSRTAIITGPNMAGKSTYMRQIAIIAIMAQIGCFVPADTAQIGIIDGIYTRVGASDDLSAGQSTFMIEMTEVAEILKNATGNSLIVFDEIGRGTSTFDGMSIARAVLEYVHERKNIGAKTLFATHYHELTAIEEALPGVKNYNIAVRKKGDKITFLRKIIRGAADDSYGIEVAGLAGVPDKVIRRAKEVLREIEEEEFGLSHRSAEDRFAEEPVQLTMESEDSQVLQLLKNTDVNGLTPMECMNLLFELTSRLKG